MRLTPPPTLVMLSLRLRVILSSTSLWKTLPQPRWHLQHMGFTHHRTTSVDVTNMVVQEALIFLLVVVLLITPIKVIEIIVFAMLLDVKYAK